MPRRTVLSAAQRASFEALPVKPTELARHYTLSDEDMAVVRQRRLPHNRLGFAAQLCLMRYPGRILRANEKLPTEIIAFVAEQVSCAACDFADYATRDQTRREHVAFLVAELGLQTFTNAYFRNTLRWLVPIAVENPKSVFLVGAVLNELRRQGILHPPLAVVERIVATSEAQADRRVFNRINHRLRPEIRQTLDDWLNVPPNQGQSRLSWVRQPVGRPTPGNVIEILERLNAIKAIGLPSDLTTGLPTARREMLAREGNRISVQNLRMFNDARRYAVMAIALLEIHRSLVDEAITMHDRIVSSSIRRSKRKHADQLQDEAKRIKKAVGTFASVGRALLQARETGQDVWQAVEAAVSWDDLRATTEDAEDLSTPRMLNHLHFVEAQFPQIRRYAPALLDHFDFQAATGGKDVLEAIQLLRVMNQTGKRRLPDDAPTSFVTAQWAPFVNQDDGLDRRYYELCALSELRNRLRSGDIWVPGSKQYQDFEGYLLGKPTFAELRKSGDVPIAVEPDCAAYMTARTELLRSQLDQVHRLLKAGHLEDITIKGRTFSVALESREVFSGALPLPETLSRAS